MTAKATVAGGAAAIVGIGAAALFTNVVTNQVPACSRTAACLSWQAPTHFVDGTAIPAGKVVTYTVYRGPTAASAGLTQVGTTTALSMILNTLPPNQTHYFGVTASVDGQQSILSNTGSKFIRAPGPTEGRIEGPSDGSIE